MTPHSRFLSLRRFDALDGLRAISVFALVWHHTAPKWVGPLLSDIGSDGVTLFFAISGFLITTLLLRERDRKATIDLKAFYWRRGLRIFPLYYGVLGLYVLAVFLFERDPRPYREFFDNLPYFVTYTSNWFVALDGRVIFYFAWSLAAEEQFYLIWPGLLHLSGTVKRAGLIAAGFLALVITDRWLGLRFLSAVPIAIVASALLALAMHSASGFGVINAVWGRRWSACVSGALLILGLVFLPPGSVLLPLLFVSFVGACVLMPAQPFARWLAIKPMVYLGSISYGMYMLHMLCKSVVTKLLGAARIDVDGLAVFFLTFGMATVVAGLSFRYFESYFLRLKLRFER
jgi:peptidoglycan/LPS O-acetylase OafA/YrhL